MTDKLPPNLLKLFAPRPPLQYFPPLDREPALKQGPTISGIGAFVSFLSDHDPDYVPSETLEERRKRKAQERKQKAEDTIREGLANWNPAEDPKIESDPFRTLFIGRLSYNTTEKDLRDEMEIYGPITKIAIPKDKLTGKPRGYAFLEFEREKDLKDLSLMRFIGFLGAYKYADGIKIMGRRVVVDVERGRSVKGWKPRRLGNAQS
ncbi:RNA-binding domain-containing protein [Basidiobolus meristosporus CBS 931.73]|uniref:U1 small nuclear ribonucleoprotein 70 kDa n=1 Tax=Basidiobolus meristosporus CBS 931.73 TaxID=1314790 RepID=A0A1Y1XW14_9FUNG|nr:RNA-binding domain-containing protein [Basidiobolus meristosporus CBS 931.73]|eukprot:ORX89865.1 RNA-binding domain-containing protein [Basidiobolus meristosporus CBS 931.73]